MEQAFMIQTHPRWTKVLNLANKPMTILDLERESLNERKTLNIFVEGFYRDLATNLLCLIRSHHTPLSMQKHNKVQIKLIMICGWIYNKLFLK